MFVVGRLHRSRITDSNSASDVCDMDAPFDVWVNLCSKSFVA
jgi:hypothetical protein